MHLAPIVTDADLLSRYLSEGDESAFSSLVKLHERMVIGTAWRHTGDPELARDVAQQVFATLANKAALLVERKSLAGWLHIAATHLASRTQVAEKARRNRQEQAALYSEGRINQDTGPVLEEALSCLGAAEREALVLHYFEDRSYPEMAAALGLQEVAVRKRVSRALKHLGVQLRRRGFGDSAITALVGAGAMQMGLLSIAAAGPSIALPAAAGSSSLALTFATLMGNTAFKITIAIALASVIPIAWQSHANSALRAELDGMQRTSERSGSAFVPSSFDPAALRANVAALTDKLAATRRRGEAVQASLAENRQALERMRQEVLVKLGKAEDLARKFAIKLEAILPVISALDRNRPSDAAVKEGLDHVTKVAMELLPYLGQLRKLDEEPEQAGRFVSTLMGEVLKLPPETMAALERTVASGYADLKRDGLTISSRPKENEKAWADRRGAADQALTARVLAILPERARNHPLFKLISESSGILLPADAAMFGGLPGGGQDDVRKAAASETAQPDRKP